MRSTSLEPREDHLAPPDAEVERDEQVRLVLAQHVAPADAQIRRPVLDIRGHVVGLEQEEAQRARLADERPIVGHKHTRVDARVRKERDEGLDRPAFRHRDGYHPTAPLTRSMLAPSPPSLASMRS